MFGLDTLQQNALQCQLLKLVWVWFCFDLEFRTNKGKTRMRPSPYYQYMPRDNYELIYSPIFSASVL